MRRKAASLAQQGRRIGLRPPTPSINHGGAEEPTGGGGNDLRLHHCRRRLGRLGHGAPAVGEEREPGVGLRGRAGYARRQGAARDPRFLSRHRLFRPALPLAGIAGPHRNRLAQPAGGAAGSAQIRAGPGPGRRLVDQRPARQSRRALRLRRVGGEGGGRLELERRLALLQEGRARHGFRRPLAWQGRPHPGSPHPPRHVVRPCQGGGRSLQGRRPNLTISAETQVSELLFEGTRCVGVKALVHGRETEFRGNEVIISSGAIHSPAHLLRAGIGPAGALRDLGIEVRMNVPGVGQRLMDHPSVSVSSFMKPEARLNGLTRRHILLALRYSSGIDGIAAGDMFVAIVSKSAWHAVGEQIASQLICVYKTLSETGQVRLGSRDWHAEPIVEFNLLSDRRDLDRLMDGFRRLGAMHLSVAFREAVSDPFPASYSDRVRQIGVVNDRNRRLTAFFAKLLDGPDWLRRWMIERFIVEGFKFDQLMTDDEALEAFIRKAGIGVWHASCTCRMGADDDPMAVTDNQGRVRGVAGLRVVDASLFPCVPCANTNFPTLMTAEKISDMMLGT